jgi:L-methionine (R)-S-oxide reductase
MPNHKEMLQELEGIVRGATGSESLMKQVCDRLHARFSRYNWVGFYLIDKNDPTTLVVGPYTGSFAPNARIPLDRGLCGLAATTGRTVVVNDVSKDPRYLTGTDLVKSEIVVPMFAGKKLIGELDIESYFLGTFTAPEQKFVEACAAMVAKYLERNPGR